MTEVAASGDWTDVLAKDGRILAMDEAQATALGLGAEVGGAAGRPWSAVYPLASRERLEALFSLPARGPHVLAVEMRRADGSLLPATAVATVVEDPAHGPCLRVQKWPRGGALDEVARLAEENHVLASILAASGDAGWCMEWVEPVDLSAPEQEIIRQVFENGPRWRFCNPAMARLYRSPEDVDFNARPVGEVFPRTPENEVFVRALIRHDFDVDASPSRDLRYDGVYIEVENDVRGDIRGNRLLRMWGTVRDVSKQARRAAALREEIERLEGILNALPDATLVVDGQGQVLWWNPAAEALWAAAQAPDQPQLADLIDLPGGLGALFAAAEAGRPGRPARLQNVALRPAGRVDVAARPLQLRGDACLTLGLRPRLELAGGPDRRAARSRAGA